MTRASRGITLVEWLVVIAIIPLMLGLLIPAVHTNHNAAPRSQCVNNLLMNRSVKFVRNGISIPVWNAPGTIDQEESIPGDRFD